MTIKSKIDKNKLGEDNKREMWRWYHNISECYYHIQITIKYRRGILNDGIEDIMKDTMRGFKERYAIEIKEVGFDKNHVHMLVQFLPKYSGGEVIRLIKSITSREIFKQMPEVKKELWGGEFWTDGYYISTVSPHGTKQGLENYIKEQGQTTESSNQLRLFPLD